MSRLFCLVPFAAALAGCAPTESSRVEIKSGDQTGVQITDSLGRKVSIAKAAERIVSLSPANTEILYALGAGDRVVAVTEFADYPPEAKVKPKVGGFAANAISIEAIVGLQPDLVLSAGALHQPVIEALERLNVPVAAVDPMSLADTYQAMDLIGTLVGKHDEAKSLTARIREHVEKVGTDAKSMPAEKRARVFFEIWDDPLRGAGRSSFQHELVELAGGANVFADVVEPYPLVSHEAVITRDPEVILTMQNISAAATLARMRSRPGWNIVAAVRDGRVHPLDYNIVSRPGPRIIEALEMVRSAMTSQSAEKAEP